MYTLILSSHFKFEHQHCQDRNHLKRVIEAISEEILVNRERVERYGREEGSMGSLGRITITLVRQLGAGGVRMTRGPERVEEYHDLESRVESHTSEGSIAQVSWLTMLIISK